MSYGVIAYLAIASGDLVGDLKTKLSTAGCLTASEFVFFYFRTAWQTCCILESVWRNLKKSAVQKSYIHASAVAVFVEWWIVVFVDIVSFHRGICTLGASL